MQRILKNIAKNEKYKEADQYAKSLDNIAKDVNWYETKTKYESYYRSKNLEKTTSQEVEAARQELLKSRKARIKDLYEIESQQYNDELAKRGLRILKDRE